MSWHARRPRPELPYPATIPGVLRWAAAEFGDRDLLVVGEERLTFAEAERRSRVLAAQLLADGVGKGTRVGLFHNYGADFVVAWLAALRIGALVMPFSTLATAAELRTMLHLGDVAVLLAAPQILGRDVRALIAEAVPASLPSPQLPYLRRVEIRAGLGAGEPSADELVAAVEEQVTPADLAQVTYTSGSEALPKGVVHSHGALVRNSSPQATRFAFDLVGLTGEVRTVFCGFPFFWVGGSLTLGQALQNGWTVCCVERFEPEAVLDVLERERVDRVWAWPSLVQALRTAPSYARRDRAYLDRVLGTPAPGPVRHRGMSETMGNWFGIETKVIDPETGQELGPDQEGELCVRGFAALQGYYKKEREDTFDPDGWLHTGDRVARREWGLEFLGRYTEMVKTRGANVSPREIEVVLESADAVRHALVFGVPDPQVGEAVVAVLVPAPGREIDLDAVAELARRELAPYKRPARYVVRAEDEIGWLPTGKPDKRGLKSDYLASEEMMAR